MFDLVFDNLRKATETSVQVQQEMFRKWTGLWPGSPLTAPMWGPAFPLQQMQARWAGIVSDLVRKQREAIEAAMRLGQQNIETALRLGEVRTVEEFRTKSLELWRKCLDGLRQTNEAQMREFQALTDQWLSLVTRPVG